MFWLEEFRNDVFRAGQTPTGESKTQTRGGEASNGAATSPEPSGATQTATTVASPPSSQGAAASGGQTGSPSASDLTLRGKALDHEAVRMALVAVGATDVGDIPAAIGGLSESGRSLLAGRFFQLEKQAGIEWGPDSDIPF